jgi:hypothetical protein
MGKDREGRFHPKKGKPSNDAKEGLGLRSAMPREDLKKDLEMTDKYTEGEDTLASNVRMRHPNRNTTKQEDYFARENGNATTQSNKTVQASFSEVRSRAEPEELPGILYKSLFEQLATYQSDCCISAYIPTHRSGVEVNEQQDRIAFKTMLQNVRTRLQERGLNQARIETLLEPGFRLLREGEQMWYNLTEGMALFVADDYFRFVRLPFTPPEEIQINNSFYVSPLVQAMVGNEHFYVLVISKKSSKLYRADNFYMEDMHIEELPQGVDDVVHNEEKDADSDLFRGGSTRTGGGIPTASYHGHAGGRPDHKETLALYMKEIDRTLWQKVLSREQAPLLLVGIDYMLPIYRSISSYPYIWEESLTGSYEHASPGLLYEKARDIMKPYFDKQQKDAFDNYMNKLATPLTTSMPDAVVRASYYNQVSDLFVQKGAHIWGHFNAQANQLDMHDEKQPNDDCLIDKAATQTILHGGRVHVLDKDQMPNGSAVAALLRFQM